MATFFLPLLTTNIMYLLSASYNAYDQQGNYHVAVWETKPTEEQLTAMLVECGNSEGQSKYKAECLLRTWCCGTNSSGGMVEYHLEQISEGKCIQSI